MVDPELEGGLVFDIYGNIHVLRSPFFDVGFDHDDDTVGDYLDRILPTLAHVIDGQLSDYDWTINGRPSASPPPPPPPPSPSLRIVGAVYLGVISFLVWFFFLRQP
ncbi:hypothetical protein MA16_Dca021331 [Dendrobium catenatum]|uniref:Uncharacterized protein n=1 Tax=Dendrobium catenatum TaxID=906689 RepID=A0A2I0WWW6_9ASPA|nr:hypothetical protein MA16_Dca021331 [Dendrobium catenatum]